MSDQKRSTYWRTHSSLRRAGLPAVLLLIMCSLALSANAWFASGRESHLQTVVTGQTATANQENARDRVEAESITLRPTGFDPKEITRRRGPFLLAASNRSGLEEVVLSLTRIDGNTVKELRVSRKQRAWQEVINLSPGQYILSEASHPDWICHITITAEY